MTSIKTALIGLTFLFFCSAGTAQLRDAGLTELQWQIETILDTPQASIEHDFIAMQNSLREIYVAGAYRPLWTSRDKIQQLIAVLEGSVEHGLQPTDYHLPVIQHLIETRESMPGPAAIAALDVLLSDGLMLYIHHRRYGKVKAGNLYPEFNFTHDVSVGLQATELIQQALVTNDLAAFIDTHSPTFSYYEAIRQQLLHYQTIASHGGWPSVPSGPTFRKDDRDPRVIALRNRLLVTGELQASSSDAEDLFGGELFNDELVQAVKAFQSLHGLDTDGIVGKQTLAAMNVGVETRVDQLRLSLERLRWIAQDLGDEFIAVNIAGFQLSYVKGRDIAWTTRVIVGSPYRKTPVFRSLLTYVEFNPTWTIPPTILRKDTIPTIRKDPGYLAAHNISVIDHSGHVVDPSTINWNAIGKNVPFILRQEPGPDNTLGQVKFIFPNPYFVYMHDTPHRALFDQSLRTRSSGCIRVENPFELAKLVLQEQQDFKPADIQGILDSGIRQRVFLDEPLPVLILYLTAALDASGEVRFYQDVYDRDAAVLRLLDGPVSANPL